MFILGDELSVFRNSDCIRRRIQLIWIQSGQEFVMFVLGDMHDAISVAFERILVSQSG
jgi:hypothetical protein